MALHLSVILFRGRGLCPGWGVCVQVGGSVSRLGGLCPWGFSVQGVSFQTGSLSKVGAGGGASVCQGGILCQGDPLCCNMRAVRILLECILVLMLCSYYPTPRPIKGPIKKRLCRVKWRCSYCTEKDTKTDFHWVLR